MNKTDFALALPFAPRDARRRGGRPAAAQTVRWAAAGDALTMDPHSQNEGPTHVMNHQVHDSLVFPRPGHEAGAAAGHRVEDHRGPQRGSSSCARA